MRFQILIFANVSIFSLLSLLHFYWVFGGIWAIEYTIPEPFKKSYFSTDNKLKITLATLVVALGLILFAIITASNYFSIMDLMKPSWTIILTRLIGGVFILRAIGDFNLLGLFKKQKDSKFAKKDSQIFVPLCLYLGLSSILITL